METRYGRGLPPDMEKSVRHALEKEAQEKKDNLKEMKKLLKKIKDGGTAAKTQASYESAPGHVKEVQGHTDYVFITEVARHFGFQEVDVPSWEEYWRFGAPMNGSNLPETGFFKKREKPFRSMERVAKSWAEHPIKFPTKPFSFMKDRNLKRAWKDFKKRLEGKKCQLKEIQKEEVKTCPIRSFGVEQGDYQIIEQIRIYNKLRSCWDFREGNAYCDQTEWMSFWATPEILGAVSAYMLGTVDMETPLRQTKKDVNVDMEKELLHREEKDWTGKEEEEVKRRPRIPYLAKLDKKAYYNQFANRDPEQVVYAMWDYEDKKFRYYEVKVLDFGSIHAIWWPVRVAQLNARVINAMGITAVVYIDDTILILDTELAEEQLSLIEYYYELCGFEMSTGKRESGMEMETVKALGYEHTRIPGVGYKVSVPERKKEEFLELAGETLEAIRKKKASPKMFERLAGKGGFIASLEATPRVWAVRALSHWATKANFYTTLNKKGAAAMRKAVEEAMEAVAGVRPVRIEEGTLAVGVAKLVTDAAAPDDPSMGGFVVGAGKERRAWTLDWRKAGKDVAFWGDLVKKETHIGIWELLAVLINLERSRRLVRGRKIYYFVDNSGDVRILAKGTANCLVSQAIVSAIMDIMEEEGVASHYAIYVNTKVNPADLLTRLSEKRLEKLSRFKEIVKCESEIEDLADVRHRSFANDIVNVVNNKLAKILKSTIPESVRNKKLKPLKTGKGLTEDKTTKNNNGPRKRIRSEESVGTHEEANRRPRKEGAEGRWDTAKRVREFLDRVPGGKLRGVDDSDKKGGD